MLVPLLLMTKMVLMVEMVLMVLMITRCGNQMRCFL